MKQATFLISQNLINEHPELANLKGNVLRERLKSLLKDPMLMEKMKRLRSLKHTIQYQADGQNLKAVYFYPDPDDWCHLSVLSIGSGFSRCYIFIYLLCLDMGIEKLADDVPMSEIMPSNKENLLKSFIELDQQNLTYTRIAQKHGKTELINQISLIQPHPDNISQ